jgi:hypothetical protein
MPSSPEFYAISDTLMAICTRSIHDISGKKVRDAINELPPHYDN